MTKDYISLGLMSGTSGDGVDASIIQSDGNTKFTPIINKYYEYDSQIYDKIHSLREKISFHFLEQFLAYPLLQCLMTKKFLWDHSIPIGLVISLKNEFLAFNII